MAMFEIPDEVVLRCHLRTPFVFNYKGCEKASIGRERCSGFRICNRYFFMAKCVSILKGLYIYIFFTCYPILIIQRFPKNFLNGKGICLELLCLLQ